MDMTASDIDEDPATRRNINDEVRVVVVDDSGDEAEALAVMLGLDGYTVKIANGGAQALVLVQRFSPHCVVLDINMPGMDGLEVAERLRAQFGDDMVLVAVTGFNADDPRVAQTFGIVDHYLRKPVEFKVLRRVLPPL